MSESNAEARPRNISSTRPETKLYRDEKGLVYETWFNGQLVYTGYIPTDTLASCYGSIVAAESMLQRYPEYTKTCSNISIDNSPVLYTGEKAFSNRTQFEQHLTLVIPTLEL